MWKNLSMGNPNQAQYGHTELPDRSKVETVGSCSAITLLGNPDHLAFPVTALKHTLSILDEAWP